MSKTILRHTLIEKYFWHFCWPPYLKMHRLLSSLQRRNICRQDLGIGIKTQLLLHMVFTSRNWLAIQGPVAIILISWNVIFIWETGYWTRAMTRFALFDLLKSLYSDTKIYSVSAETIISDAFSDSENVIRGISPKMMRTKRYRWISWSHPFESCMVTTMTWLTVMEYLCHKVPLVIKHRFFCNSRLVTGFVIRLTQHVPLVFEGPHHFWTYTSNLTTVVNSVLKFMISGTTSILES
jgi:hypothetical protein